MALDPDSRCIIPGCENKGDEYCMIFSKITTHKKMLGKVCLKHWAEISERVKTNPLA